MAARTLNYGIDQIVLNKGDLTQMFHLIRQDGSYDVVLVDDEVTNNRECKIELGEDLRRRVQSGGIQAVIMLSDTLISFSTRPELQAFREVFQLTIEDCMNLGIIPRREAVACSLETADYQQTAIQEYKIVDGRIELVGDPLVTVADEHSGYQGILMGLFPKKAEAAR